MSTVTSHEVSSECVSQCEQAAAKGEGQPAFIVVRNEGSGDELAGMFDDRDEAVGMAEALNTVNGACSAYAAERIGAGNGQSIASPPRVTRFGVIRIPNEDGKFRPNNGRTMPQMMATRLPSAMAWELAIGLNAETLGQGGGRWHFMVCTHNEGYGVIRVAFQPYALPSAPDSYGLTGRGVLYHSSGEVRRIAQAEAEKRNDAIIETARVPRVWHLAVHDLRVEPTEG